MIIYDTEESSFEHILASGTVRIVLIQWWSLALWSLCLFCFCLLHEHPHPTTISSVFNKLSCRWLWFAPVYKVPDHAPVFSFTPLPDYSLRLLNHLWNFCRNQLSEWYLKSDLESVKRKGGRRVPCGTPLLPKTFLETWLWSRAYHDLQVR